MFVSRSIYSGFILLSHNQLSILPKHANPEEATSRNQRFCLCLRLDNDIIKAISPLSSVDAVNSLSLDASQLFRR